MAGRIVVDEPPAPDRWDRFALEFADGGRLALRDKRRLGRAVLEPDYSHVGPDAAEVGRDAFRARVGRGAAPLKARLLDQGVIAGVGNLLADETLWRARLSPRRRGGLARGRGARPAAPRPARGDARRDPQRRRPHRPLHAVTASAAARCPRCRDAARARHDRRAGRRSGARAASRTERVECRDLARARAPYGRHAHPHRRDPRRAGRRRRLRRLRARQRRAAAHASRRRPSCGPSSPTAPRSRSSASPHAAATGRSSAPCSARSGRRSRKAVAKARAEARALAPAAGLRLGGPLGDRP